MATPHAAQQNDVYVVEIWVVTVEAPRKIKEREPRCAIWKVSKMSLERRWRKGVPTQKINIHKT